MMTNSGRLVLAALAALTLSTISVAGSGSAHDHRSGVEPLFDLDSPSGGPFPSDMFTVPDHRQNTGVRVNLPKPDCAAYPYDCAEIDLLNELDGFHIQPRASIPFSGLIDPASVTSRNVFFLRLDDDGRGHHDWPAHHKGRRENVVGINQVVWDTTDLPYSLRVTAAEVLEQHTRYALIVTRGVLDANGDPVEASPEFEGFRRDLNFGHTDDPEIKEYRKDLLDALGRAAVGVSPHEVVVASVFTTESVTASLEKIRKQIKASMPEPAGFVLALMNTDGTPSGGTVRAVFNVADIVTSTTPPVGVVVNQQIGVLPDRFQTFSARLAQLRFIPGAVQTMAVGKYASPVYARNGVIPPFGTRTGTPEVFGQNDVYFTVFLPAGAPPPGGWPVVLYGPGQPDEDIWGTPLNIAASLAAHGLATVSVQSAWHGYGPKTTATITLRSGSRGDCPAAGACAFTIPGGGRNSDKNGDTNIIAAEAVIPYAYPADPRTILYTRDAWRQTAADTMQFVHVLQKVGVDVDGDGASDFDPSRIYYAGFSAGGSRGMAFVAVEPSVKAAVFNSAAGPVTEPLSPVNRPFQGTILGAHPPYAPRLSPPWSSSLLNPAGEPLVAALDCEINGERTPFCYDTSHGGVVLPTTGASSGPWFNENLPLRNEPAVSNTVRGALDIQQYFERRAWLGALATPGAFAPHLQKEPLTGAVPRPVLFLFARGDETSPNPGAMALLRAGSLEDSATLFRNDLAYTCNPAPAFEKNPHSFMLRLNGEPRQTIAMAAQEQVARFLASDGTDVMTAEELNDRVAARACGLPVFEVGVENPIEDLMFIP